MVSVLDEGNYEFGSKIPLQYTLKDFLEKYKPEEHNMFLASTKSQKCYSDVDYSKMEEVFVLFGKETKGLPEELITKYIDKAIRIPMRDSLRSLNLSNSVAIMVYEVLRQQDYRDLFKFEPHKGEDYLEK